MADPLVGALFAGLLLAGGGLTLVLLVGPTAFVSPAIWNGPQDVALRLIAEHSLLWRLANLGFVLATVLTTAGLFLVPGLVGDRGTSPAWAAAVAFLLAAVPWLLVLAIRLAITPGVADGFVADGTVDPAFVPIARLGGAMAPAFMLLAWACIVAGAFFGGGYVLLGDMLPAFVYFPTTAIGVALLLASR